MPDWKRYVRTHLPPLGLRPEREADILAELTAGFEQAYQDAVDTGSDPRMAEQQARMRVTDWNALAAEFRAANVDSPPPIEPPSNRLWPAGWWFDLRLAIRGLARNPSFAAIAILTLAFGIGGNTALFTVVDHIALRGLPYPDADRLLSVEHTAADQPDIEPWCSIDNLLDLRARSTRNQPGSPPVFEAIAGISPVWNVVLSGNGETERLEALFVSNEFLPMLGVKPVAGRLFTAAEDDRVQPASVAILSHGFWMRRFGGSPGAIGATLRLDGRAVTAIGVLPQEFRWLGEPLSGAATQPDLWLPLASNPLAKTPRSLRFLKLVAKRSAGVSLESAREEVRRAGAALTAAFPTENRALRFDTALLSQRVMAPLRGAVILLAAAMGFVLLMSSANVANLLLANAAVRTRDMAVRVALGASWPRLLRQLLTESLVLAVAGGAAGLFLAYVLVEWMLVHGPPALLQRAGIVMDGRVAAYTAAVVVASALLAGFAPAWSTLRAGIAPGIRDGRGVTRSNRRFRAALSIAQVAIALSLAVCSGLLLRSLWKVLAVDPGFDSRNVLSVTTQTPAGSSPELRTAIYNQIRERMLATPGVEAVGAVSRLPLLGQTLTSQFAIEGREPGANPPEVEFRAATASYFPTMRIPLLAGRLFEDRDLAKGYELVLDSLAARRFFGDEDPVGKRVRFLADRNGPWFTIVGVVGAIRHFGLEAAPRPTVYRHTSINPLNTPVLLIRTAGDPSRLAPALSAIAREAHAGMPSYNVFSLEELVNRTTAQRRFLMWVILVFTSAALLLAAVGVYGAIAQSVAQRTRELGVRMALGASRGAVLAMVLNEGLRMAAVGTAVGLAIAWAAARFGSALLFQVRPGDPAVYACASIVVVAAVLAACYLPARRAAALDPMTAIREE